MIKVIEVIPYKNFKEKVRLTKQLQNLKVKVQDLGGLLYIERYEVEV